MIIYKKPKNGGIYDIGPNFKVIIYCEIVESKVIYIGSIFFRIIDKKLQFISIYKSALNKCNTCTEEKSFSLLFLDNLTKKCIENGYNELEVIYPIGIMKDILINYGFSEERKNFGIYHKLLPSTGGKIKSKRNNKRKKLKSKKNNKRKKLKSKTNKK